MQLTVRAKLDSYNGEVRTNVVCIDARPVSLGERGRVEVAMRDALLNAEGGMQGALAHRMHHRYLRRAKRQPGIAQDGIAGHVGHADVLQHVRRDLLFDFDVFAARWHG